MRIRLLLALVVLGGLSLTQAQTNKKTNPLDGATVKSSPANNEQRIETKTGSYTLQPNGNDRYRINTGSDTYTVRPRWTMDGSYQVENDRNPNESYTMKRRWDGSYQVESEHPSRRQNNHASTDDDDAPKRNQIQKGVKEDSRMGTTRDVRSLDTYREYELSVMALRASDPKKILELVDALQQRNPKSQYLPQMSGIYLNAMAQSGQPAKACSTAERLAAENATDGEALLFAGDCALRANQADRAIFLGTQALDAIKPRPKPEGMSDSDWSVRKAALVGRANWIVGVGYGVQQKFDLANRALRAALPEVKSDAQLMATALFYLGSANYYLGKGIGDKKQMREGMEFFEQCATISSTLQQEASKSAQMIRFELGIN